MLRPIRWGRTIGLSSTHPRPVGLTPTYRLVPRHAGWGRSGVVVTTFGNLDPWRMVANDRFRAELVPTFDGMREDPYDNQMGEALVDGRGCRQREMLRKIELIGLISDLSRTH